MRNDYFVKQGWYDGYHGFLMESRELEILTREELLDYSEGLDAGKRDTIIDEDGASMEGYHEEQE